MTGIHSPLRQAMVKGARVILAALGLLAAGAMQSWAAPVTYNAVTEFNSLQGGTTGVWNYGRLDGAGGTFTQGTIAGGNFKGPGAGNYLLVGAGFMHPGCLVLDPPPGQQPKEGCEVNKAFANLRFSAPTAGTYTATFQVRLSDPSNNPFFNPNAYPDYRRDGVRMWLGSAFNDLSTFQGPDAVTASRAGKTLTQTFTLAAGQFIDFSVDHNGARECSGCTPSPNRFNLYDSTIYAATVSLQAVPEPSSALLVAAALCSLGWARPRARRRATDERRQ